MKSRTRNVRGSKKPNDTRASTSSTSSTLASAHPTSESVNIHSFTSKRPDVEGSRPDTSQRAPTTTSMETEYIEELYSKMSMQEAVSEPHSDSRIDFDLDDDDDNYIDCSEDADGEYDDHKDDDHQIHGDISNSTQNTILMELQREHLEFEENVRQLQQHLRQQSSLETFEEGFSSDDNLSEGSIGSPFPSNNLNSYDMDYFLETTGMCARCVDPKPTLCLETYGRFWRPFIVRAMATAAAAIAQYHDIHGTRFKKAPFSNFLPRSQLDIQAANKSNLTLTNGVRSQENPPQSNTRYPLPPDATYKFGRKGSEYLEPVGEFHEFQSAEGNSRQVLLHVWPPSSLDITLLQKLEQACKDFQEHEVVRGHSGDGFLNGWRPSWKEPQQTGVLRFGHWRVRAPADHGTDLYAPFQTPLTLAAAGGSVLGPSVVVGSNSRERNGATLQGGTPEVEKQKQGRNGYATAKGVNLHEHCQPGKPCVHGQIPQPQPPEPSPQGHNLDQSRLLRLVRAIQMVEKGIIARHLKYLFPTLYEKYHGLQFGTPRLFDAVATVALSMDVSPRLHHDKAHTKHGFCWIVACGDFVGGDLCIPELGKRVVMRPGTVVAIRSTVVAYYIERYAKNTSMYTMYAYTADNCWPPTE
ncbi:hypothetical protein BG005_001498 [Podila minutissima]|nr:hypothetical protein BG005_001498 [Podila minutissima]